LAFGDAAGGLGWLGVAEVGEAFLQTALNRPDVAEELSGETVAKALHYFRENVLMRQRWNASKGASIKTYFIGQSLFQFANVYRYSLPIPPPHQGLSEMLLSGAPAGSCRLRLRRASVGARAR
jgi:hypothetical protein